MAVPTSAIIEQFDVIIDLGGGYLASRVDALLDPLLVQATKERFGHCVIPAIATSAHAGLQVMRAAEAPPCIAAKLRSLIGMNQGVLGLASADGHDERVQHQVLSQCGLGGPTNNTAGVEIHHDGQIEPAFPRAYIRNVRDPDGVRPWDGKPLLQYIGREE